MSVPTMKDYQKLGAAARLEQIQVELDHIHANFPDLFPSGAVVVAPLRRRMVTDKKAQAKRMIEGADKIAKQAKGKAKPHKPRPNPNLTGSDPTGETLTVSEAAKVLGMTPSGFDYSVRMNKIRVFKIDDQGVRRFLRSDVIKLGIDLGKLDATLAQEAVSVQQEEAVAQ